MILPYKEDIKSKKEQVVNMFDNIAPRYDFLNHLLSAGIDRAWRRKAVRMLGDVKPEQIIDIATGTGDLAIEACRQFPDSKVTGIDIAEKMLHIGRKKLLKKDLDRHINLICSDAEHLSFKNNTFDSAITAFGIRNFENLSLGLSEIFRVLKPGGKLVVLEFSRPASFPFRYIYGMYFKKILPFVGRFFSHDPSAYKYLPESVTAFPEGEDLMKILRQCGFVRCGYSRLTFGIATLYFAYRETISTA